MDTSLLPNIVAFLKMIVPFNHLSLAVLDTIARQVEIVYLGKGEFLYQEEKPCRFLYLIRSGVIEQREQNGSLRARMGAEDIFGFSLQSQETYQVVALEHSLIYRLDYRALVYSIVDYPHVTEQLALSANQRLQSTVNVKWAEGDKGIFFKRVVDVAQKPIAIATPDMTIQQVACLMRHEMRSSCAVIVDDKRLLGMITDKDMTKRVVADGVLVSRPITDVMTEQPIVVGQQELVLKAVQLMMLHNIQNVPVLDDDQKVVGVITPQQLVQKHSVQAVFLIENIRRCESVEALSFLGVQRQAIFEAMAEANLSAHLIGQVMAMIYDAFTRQLVDLAQVHLGPTPCRYVWLAAGSHARNEVHLGSDQDNALVLEDSATESDRSYFRHFAMYICKGLAKSGYDLCSGRFMAATPKWCQSLTVWKQYYRKWAKNPEYDMLLNLTVFLEIRPLAGDESIFEELNSFRLEQVRGNAKLMVALVHNALSTKPPLGVFNKLVLKKNGKNDNYLNIKKSAIQCLVDLARIYAIHEGGDILNTEERMDFSFRHEVINEMSYQDLIGTYRFVNQLRYSHHLQCLRKGVAVSNYLLPENFSSFERQHLKDVFRIIYGFQQTVKMRFGG